MNYKVYRAGFVYYGSFATLVEAADFALTQAARLDDLFMVWSIAGANVIFDTRG